MTEVCPACGAAHFDLREVFAELERVSNDPAALIWIERGRRTLACGAASRALTGRQPGVGRPGNPDSPGAIRTARYRSGKRGDPPPGDAGGDAIVTRHNPSQSTSQCVTVTRHNQRHNGAGDVPCLTDQITDLRSGSSQDLFAYNGVTDTDQNGVTIGTGDADCDAVDCDAPTNARAADVRLVFGHWLRVMGKNPRTTKLTPDRRRVIRARLNEGYPAETLMAAVDGCRRSPFHMGDNDRNQPYNDLVSILRNGSRVEEHSGRTGGPLAASVPADPLLAEQRRLDAAIAEAQQTNPDAVAGLRAELGRVLSKRRAAARTA